MAVDLEELRACISSSRPPFSLNKIGHVVLMVSDLVRSTAFYTGVLGFRVSDIYGDDMMPGGMVFMRCNTDHHGIALVGGAAGPAGLASPGIRSRIARRRVPRAQASG